MVNAAILGEFIVVYINIEKSEKREKVCLPLNRLWVQIRNYIKK